MWKLTRTHPQHGERCCKMKTERCGDGSDRDKGWREAWIREWWRIKINGLVGDVWRRGGWRGEGKKCSYKRAGDSGREERGNMRSTKSSHLHLNLGRNNEPWFCNKIRDHEGETRERDVWYLWANKGGEWRQHTMLLLSSYPGKKSMPTHTWPLNKNILLHRYTDIYRNKAPSHSGFNIKPGKKYSIQTS